ncbi:hypothetical protein [Geitlerinema sp. PCC 7407]|uniref:hypothetical protein n=1 Tax=Geitlerinema sp. PCC 7407 TaxID=1173025 RepID=UPI00029FDC7F|nr:hypothetical protein [Geitlerinema sp. PCC 7407]AFY64990.1 hypothetical protein GEI7407_0490 [Geitlerinema sp. PCC 7407]
MKVYVQGRRHTLKATDAIAKGGEADIFALGPNRVLKRFKDPQHPDYARQPHAQQAARDRLHLHQQKLPAFPKNLPARVVAPEAIATDGQGTIVGYTMPRLDPATVLLKYGDRSFRQAVPTAEVIEVFRDLHGTVTQLHQAGVVIGDFNDLNVLVQGSAAYLIDADSFQYGSFPCQVFTARFLDPQLGDPQAGRFQLAKPYTPFSDWYAFAVMLMQSLLFVDPYGGVYKPRASSPKIPPSARPLHRITVFHPEVRYPKPALPYGVLSDDLLHYFQAVFAGDRREVFPRSLLDGLRWTTCTRCGTEHARSCCPRCTPAQTAPALPTPAAQTARSVSVSDVFESGGVILCAAVQQGRLRWLVHEQGEFRREDGSVAFRGALDPQTRFGVQGDATLVARAGQWLKLRPGHSPDRLTVEAADGNAQHRYWAHQGQLWRDGDLGPVYLGDVLAGQTQFWVGDRFGMGFYRAGHLSVAFVFDAQRPGINDRVALPPMGGQLIDATCTFSEQRAWLFLTSQDQGQRVHRCCVIRADGTVEATATAIAGDDHWLARLGLERSLPNACPACAVGAFLLAATDDGIVRIDLQAGQLVHTHTFTETEPFVNASCHLLPAPQGLYSVSAHRIRRLTLG